MGMPISRECCAHAQSNGQIASFPRNNAVKLEADISLRQYQGQEYVKLFLHCDAYEQFHQTLLVKGEVEYFSQYVFQ
jgi:hypothetical protein